MAEVLVSKSLFYKILAIKQHLFCRYGLLYKSARKPPRKKGILIIEVDLVKLFASKE